MLLERASLPKVLRTAPTRWSCVEADRPDDRRDPDPSCLSRREESNDLQKWSPVSPLRKVHNVQHLK